MRASSFRLWPSSQNSGRPQNLYQLMLLRGPFAHMTKHRLFRAAALWMAFVLPDTEAFFTHIISRSIASTRFSRTDYSKIWPSPSLLLLPALRRMHQSTDSSNGGGDDDACLGDPMEGLPRPLLLGSASFTRKLILKEMGIRYSVVVRPIDERNLGNRETDAPEELVRKLAHAKMEHLVAEIRSGHCNDDLPDQGRLRQDWVALTADQVVTCNGKILEKPDNIDQAKAFVAQYGTHPCSTVGCVVLSHLPSRITVSGLHIATVHFKATLTAANASRLVDDLIRDYDAPILSCAGGLMIEHPLTQQYVDRIDGTEDSIMGLSKETVSQLLQELRLKLQESGVRTRIDGEHE